MAMRALLVVVALALSAVSAGAETLSLRVLRAEAFVNRETLYPGVRATLTPESAGAFQSFTRGNLGKKIRVRVGGEAVATPTISQPATDDTLVILGDLTVDDTTQMAKQLNEGGAILVDLAPPEKVSLQAKRAAASLDQATRQPVVTIMLTNASAKAFAEFTTAHVGRQVSITIGGNILATPILREPILNGSTQISGNMTVQDAAALAKQIHDGARIDVEVMPRR